MKGIVTAVFGAQINSNFLTLSHLLSAMDVHFIRPFVFISEHLNDSYCTQQLN